MSHMTTAEAYAAAQERGLRINLDTVRRIARENGLTVRLGHKVFIKTDRWLKLIDEGQSDSAPASRARQTQHDS